MVALSELAIIFVLVFLTFLITKKIHNTRQTREISQSESSNFAIGRTAEISSDNGENEEWSDCWRTGCQLDTWEVVGCEQYNRTERETFSCSGGYEYECCIKNEVSQPSDELYTDCWRTGCQMDTWEVVGCEQYNRTEREKFSCSGGYEYECCIKNEISLPLDEWYTGCWRTGCQPNTWAVVGCAQYQMTEIERFPCAGGYEYQCCTIIGGNNEFSNVTDLDEYLDNFYKPEDKESELPQYINYVKGLLLSSDDFSIDTDPFPCTDIDPTKEFAIQESDYVIKICDICPYLPFEKLTNVFLNMNATFTWPNSAYIECVAYCLNEQTCVALSYDSEDKVCYGFNSTNAESFEEPNYSTVIITQPKGTIRDWIYTRNTKLSGNGTTQLTTNTFIECLDVCSKDVKNVCSAVSFEYATKTCTTFNATNFDRIDYIYGHLAALNINLTQGGESNRWRFSLYNTLEEEQVNNTSPPTMEKFPTEEFGSFYNPSCSIQPLSGCNQETGFQKCYYPEYNGSTHPLPICQDSRFKQYESIESQHTFLEKCMTECTLSAECRGVDFSNEDLSCSLLDYKTLLRQQLNNRKPYILTHPISRNIVEKNFDLFFGSEIVESQESQASIIRATESTDELECVGLCYNTTSCSLVSYNWNTRKCILAVGAVISKMDSNAMTFSRKSDFMSPKLGFAYLFATGVEGPELQRFETECSQPNCEQNVVTCLNTCLGNELCKFVGVTYAYNAKNRAVCKLYAVNETSIQWDAGQEVYVRTAKSLSFELSVMDEISVFQPSDFWSCFRNSSRQTQSTLQISSNDDDPSTAVSLRRRRGFFDAIGNAFKSIGKAIVSVVEDIGKTIVKTGETIGKVVTGDFKGALKTVQEIPIVQDVKHVVESGVKVVNGIKDGNWEEVGKGVLDIGIGAVGLIPGPGKIGGKIVGKVIGKQGAKDVAKNVDVKKVDKGNKKGSNDKDKDKEKEPNNACPKRSKRATATKNTPGNASKKNQCDPDKCKSTGVLNVDQKFKDNCNNKNVGSHCEFICQAGYDESKVSPVCNERNDEAFWNPLLKCDSQSCVGDSFPLRVKAYRKLLGDLDINSYYVKFDKKRRLPVHSSSFHDILQHQTGDMFANFAVTRKNSFSAHPCTQLRSEQSNRDTDYKMTPSQMTRSGKTAWDRGHLTPFQAQSFSYKSAITSNMFVNVAPQDPYTNETPWRLVEAYVFCLLKGLNNAGIVISGVCAGTQDRTMSGLEVPDCFWKLVCYKDPAGETGVIGFIAENSIIGSADANAKAQRKLETKKFRPQREIIARSGVDISSAWLTSAGYIFKGRSTTGVFNPPFPAKCAAALDLSSNLPTWGDSKKRKRDRKKRAVTFGCGADDMMDTMAIFGDSDKDENGNANDDEDMAGSASFTGSSCGKRLIGYYPSWGTTKFTNIQGRALTHAVFAFFQTFEDGSIKLGTADPTNSKNPSEDLEIAKSRLANFKRIGTTFASLKTMFAIGGWENSNYFSRIAADPQKRLRLIASALEIIVDHDFDGIDIDWEHPVTGGAVEGVPADKQNYVTLLQELRNAFNEHEKKTGRSDHLLISFAGAAGQWTLDPGLDLPNMLKYADFANVMSYDYFGAWASKWGAYTGPPSPLYFGNPKGFSGKVNADWSVKYYVCRTKEPHKVNMGVPFYGRFWKNVGDPIDPADGMWRKAEQVNGVFEGGFVPWKEIKAKWINDPGFTVTMHEKAKTPYAWNPATKTFLGFENPESLAFKVQYAEDKNLGGLMIWAIDQDDEENSMLDTLLKANLCKERDPKKINHRCPPITEKRWWTPEDGYDKAGMCGKPAPLFKGYYPVCDPDDPGYSCCGAFGYCGSGKDFCDCPTCVDYLKYPEKILDEPIKPTIPVNWYFLNDEDGKRGRCGRDAPLLKNKIPICNPDDVNGHCCSNGGYCGATKDFCECDTCIDFKKNPNYEYKPKTWWSWSDGEDKAGKCGEKAPKLNGKIAECDSESKDAYCCSEWGSCGQGAEFCDCSKCVNYKKR